MPPVLSPLSLVVSLLKVSAIMAVLYISKLYHYFTHRCLTLQLLLLPLYFFKCVICVICVSVLQWMSERYGQKISAKMGNPVKCLYHACGWQQQDMETGISACTGEDFKSSLIGVTSQCSASYFLSPSLQPWNLWLGGLNHPAYYDSIRNLLCCATCNHHNTLQLNPF